MFKSKFLTFLLAAVCAFALWCYVITFVSADREETFYDIPVSFQGEAILEDRRLMVVSEKPTVTLTLNGNRAELNKLDNTKITIRVDLSKIDGPGVHDLSYNVYYPGDIPSNAFTVQSQYPGMVKIEVERRVTKEIPVVTVFDGAVKTNYIADEEEMELDHEMITVTGPASVVDRISQARVNINLEGRSDSFSEAHRFTLCDAQNQPVDAEMVEVNVTEVNVTMYIKAVKEIKLVYTVIAGGGATEQTSTITVEPASIKVAGNENALQDLDELNIGVIDLGTILTDTKMTREIKLPEGITNLSGVTEAVLSVSFPDLMTKTFTITRFVPVNVPEGMQVEFITQELAVTVRGPKELVRKMNTGHITVKIDFADAKLGSSTYNATVTIVSVFSKVGAMGTYRISATLLEEIAEDGGGK